MVSKPSASDAARPAGPEATAPASEPAAASAVTVAAAACDQWPLAARIAAVLLVADRAMPDARLIEVLGIAGTGDAKGAAAAVKEAIDELNAAGDEQGRAFRIERVAGGWRVMTRPDFGPLLDRLHADRRQTRLSPAAMETLSVIAYRQPIMRAEIEAIRGVACGEVLRGLMERRLVRITGRSEELGRPMLYGTTRQFLDVFGLASLEDLPSVEGLARRPAYVPPKPAGPADDDRSSDDDGDESAADGSVVSDETSATGEAPAETDADGPAPEATGDASGDDAAEPRGD